MFLSYPIQTRVVLLCAYCGRVFEQDYEWHCPACGAPVTLKNDELEEYIIARGVDLSDSETQLWLSRAMVTEGEPAC